jgi:hypothetical protein
LDSLRSDYVEKFRRGEESQKDYVNLQLGRELEKYGDSEKKLKIAERRKDVQGDLAEGLHALGGAGTAALLRGINDGQLGPIVSSNPHAVEYLGGNDEVAAALSISVTRYHEDVVIRTVPDVQGATAQLTAAQAARFVTRVALWQGTDAGPVSVEAEPGQGDSIESLARKITERSNGALTAFAVSAPDGGDGVASLVIRPGPTALPYGFMVHYTTAAGNDGFSPSQGGADVCTRFSVLCGGHVLQPDVTCENGSNRIQVGGPTGPRFLLKARTDDANAINQYQSAVSFRRGPAAAADVSGVREVIDRLNVVLKKVSDLVAEKPNRRVKLPVTLHPENMTLEERKDRAEKEQKVVAGAFASDQHLKTLLSTVRSSCSTFDLASYGLRLERRNGLQLVIADEKKLADVLQRGLLGADGVPAVSAAEVRRRLAGVRSDEANFRGGLLTQLCEAASVCSKMVTDKRRLEDRQFLEWRMRLEQQYDSLLKKEQREVERYNKANAKVRRFEEMQSMLMSMQAAKG